MLVLTLLQLLAATPVERTPTGLLLGLASGDLLTTYFTDGDSIFKLGDGLAVPTPRGWLRARFVRGEKDKTSVRAISVAPAGATIPSAFTLLPSEWIALTADSCSHDFSANLLFIDANVATIWWANSGDCGGAHPGHWDALATVAATSPSSLASLPLSKVFGGQAAPAQWGLEHANGCWAAFEAADNGGWGMNRTVLNVPLPSGIACGGGVDAGIGQPAPLDEVRAPDGSFVLLIFEDRLELRRGQVALSRLGFKAPAARPSVVMTQWTVGLKNMQRVEREARATLR